MEASRQDVAAVWATADLLTGSSTLRLTQLPLRTHSARSDPMWAPQALIHTQALFTPTIPHLTFSPLSMLTVSHRLMHTHSLSLSLLETLTLSQ